MGVEIEQIEEMLNTTNLLKIIKTKRKKRKKDEITNFILSCPRPFQMMDIALEMSVKTKRTSAIREILGLFPSNGYKMICFSIQKRLYSSFEALVYNPSFTGIKIENDSALHSALYQNDSIFVEGVLYATAKNPGNDGIYSRQLLYNLIFATKPRIYDNLSRYIHDFDKLLKKQHNLLVHACVTKNFVLVSKLINLGVTKKATTAFYYALRNQSILISQLIYVKCDVEVNKINPKDVVYLIKENNLYAIQMLISFGYGEWNNKMLYSATSIEMMNMLQSTSMINCDTQYFKNKCINFIN